MATPELTAPAGGDQTRAPLLLGMSITMTLLATAALGARLFTRFRILRRPGLDDYILIITMVVFIYPTLILTAIPTAWGFGRHRYYLNPDDVVRINRLDSLSCIFSISAPVIPKLAVVNFIHKIVGKTQRVAIVVLYFLTISATIMYIADTFFLFFQCDPPNYSWNFSVVPKCWNPAIITNYSLFLGAFSAFLDFLLALYPSTFIWKLKLELKRRIATMVIMGLGIFAGAVAIVRTTTLVTLKDHTDLTWNQPLQAVWVMIEANLIVICASMPAMLPLIYHVRGTRDYSGRDMLGNSDRARQVRPGSGRTPLNGLDNPSYKNNSFSTAQSAETSISDLEKPVTSV